MVRSRPISTADHRATADTIDAILAGGYWLPETNGIFQCPIKSLCIASDLSGREHDLVRALKITGRQALVCDANTFDALGERVARCLSTADMIVLDAPKADQSNASDLMDRTRHADTLIAIGAGTLNDLCKYVSHQRRRPYIVFPTAPSMNGYTTATASISRDGEKLSLPATPPLAVFFDLDILAKAPARLIAAGVGDALCRSTVQVDWLLSHLLLDTPYMATPFALQTAAETDLLSRAGELRHGDLDAMRALVQLLVLGGLGMLIAGNSQPGSQGEHLISHYIDMLRRPHPGTLHGEQVGLAAWTMARLQHHILGSDTPPAFGETVIDAGAMMRRYGKLGPACLKAIQTKAIKGRRLDRLNEKLESRWSTLTSKLNGIALAPDDLKAALDAGGLTLDADALGIGRHFYADAIRHARELRDRFTMLDLAAEAGSLDPFIERHLTST